MSHPHALLLQMGPQPDSMAGESDIVFPGVLECGLPGALECGFPGMLE